MKKHIVTLIIILASITSIYALNEHLNSSISLDKVSQINLYHDGNLKDTYTPKEAELDDFETNYETLIDAINNMTKSQTKSLIDNNYVLDIILESERLSYKIYLDVENVEIYFSENNDQNDTETFYQIQGDMKESLFNLTLFDDLYFEKAISNTILSIGDKQISPIFKANLVYKTPFDFENNASIAYSNDNNTIEIDNYNSIANIAFEDEADSLTLLVYDGETEIHKESLEESNFKLLKQEKLLTYKIIASWINNDTRHFSGDAKYSFDVHMKLDPEFELVDNNKGAGEFFIIKGLYLDDDEKPMVKSDSIRNKDFVKNVDEYLLVIPLNYYQRKASYDIDLYIVKDEKETLVDTKELIVENRDFIAQRLTIDKSTVAATSTDNAYTEFAKYFTPSREKSNPKAYFTESFILPIDGRISTQFGMMRYVNGSLTSYRHSGLDIAVPRGTPVPATNTGKIVLSMELILTGNTVVIDHGVGLFSVYYHMDTLNVEKDQMVSRGDIIGTVGSTGRSTGPHLHFTTSFYKTNMNPNFLIDLSKDELENLIR